MKQVFVLKIPRNTDRLCTTWEELVWVLGEFGKSETFLLDHFPIVIDEIIVSDASYADIARIRELAVYKRTYEICMSSGAIYPEEALAQARKEAEHESDAEK